MWKLRLSILGGAENHGAVLWSVYATCSHEGILTSPEWSRIEILGKSIRLCMVCVCRILHWLAVGGSSYLERARCELFPARCAVQSWFSCRFIQVWPKLKLQQAVELCQSRCAPELCCLCRSRKRFWTNHDRVYETWRLVIVIEDVHCQSYAARHSCHERWVYFSGKIFCVSRDERGEMWLPYSSMQ